MTTTTTDIFSELVESYRRKGMPAYTAERLAASLLANIVTGIFGR